MKDSKSSFHTHILERHQDKLPCASKQEVVDFLRGLIHLLFPDYGSYSFNNVEEIQEEMEKLRVMLYQMICKDKNESENFAAEVTSYFFEALPATYKMLEEDVKAMFEGDPAAKSQVEVIKTYPGFLAIFAYRIAHLLEKKKVRIVPRMITEYAHSHTGIDIHPGATIGRHFCIDHGTGVVIGETTVIGEHVKIYQGVTLGALSVEKSSADTKRHPTLEDHVVIYAGATILGGETVIGSHSVVGGNVWLTRSIQPNSKVYYKAAMHEESTDKTDVIVYKSMAL